MAYLYSPFLYSVLPSSLKASAVAISKLMKQNKNQQHFPSISCITLFHDQISSEGRKLKVTDQIALLCNISFVLQQQQQQQQCFIPSRHLIHICIENYNNLHYYPTAANTIQITVQIYSDIAQLFVQQKTCLPHRSARLPKTVTLSLSH